MHVDLGIWDKLSRLVIFLLCVAGLLGVAVWYLPLIHQNERMREEVLRLETNVQKEEMACKQLRAAIESLKYDPKAVERLVRERLGYAKPGETIVHFIEPAGSTAVRPQ
jgi:cell division protein FtsB